MVRGERGVIVSGLKIDPGNGRSYFYYDGSETSSIHVSTQIQDRLFVISRDNESLCRLSRGSQGKNGRRKGEGRSDSTSTLLTSKTSGEPGVLPELLLSVHDYYALGRRTEV